MIRLEVFSSVERNYESTPTPQFKANNNSLLTSGDTPTKQAKTAMPEERKGEPLRPPKAPRFAAVDPDKRSPPRPGLHSLLDFSSEVKNYKASPARRPKHGSTSRKRGKGATNRSGSGKPGTGQRAGSRNCSKGSQRGGAKQDLSMYYAVMPALN